MGNFISTLILIVSLCVFIYAAYQLVTIYLAYKTGVDEYKELSGFLSTERIIRNPEDDDSVLGEKEDVQVPGESETEGEPVDPNAIRIMENPVDFESLCAINRDVIGWLDMEAIDISYPMVQGEDNDYYLHRTFQRTDNFAGSIFMDYLNDRDFSDRNSIIYGHNMKNGSMFGILKKYREADIFTESPYFWIYAPDYIYKYEIFSYCEVDVSSDAYQIDFNNDEDFQEYLYKMKDYSERRIEVELTADDTIVTLSTCTGNDATRFIVQGKKIETYRSVPKAGGYEEKKD